MRPEQPVLRLAVRVRPVRPVLRLAVRVQLAERVRPVRPVLRLASQLRKMELRLVVQVLQLRKMELRPVVQARQLRKMPLLVVQQIAVLQLQVPPAWSVRCFQYVLLSGPFGLPPSEDRMILLCFGQAALHYVPSDQQRRFSPP